MGEDWVKQVANNGQWLFSCVHVFDCLMSVSVGICSHDCVHICVCVVVVVVVVVIHNFLLDSCQVFGCDQQRANEELAYTIR